MHITSKSTSNSDWKLNSADYDTLAFSFAEISREIKKLTMTTLVFYKYSVWLILVEVEVIV